ncbi:hypothetical protein BLAT2472_30512 [Burkholderia latens]
MPARALASRSASPSDGGRAGWNSAGTLATPRAEARRKPGTTFHDFNENKQEHPCVSRPACCARSR